MADDDARGGELPRVWVLLGYGAGGNAQMHALARAIGWPYEAKQLRYNALNRLPNPLLGASRATIARRRSDVIEPPWPDLVIAASRRAAPVARWIRKASGGRSLLVHLLHAQAPLHHFDLVVTLAQYRLPDAPNVLHNTLPLNRFDPADLAQAGERWATSFSHLPRPWIGVLIGGNSSSYRLDARTAARMGREINVKATQTGGSLLITTSRRTPEKAAEALFAQITAPSVQYRWQPDDDANPYAAILALADRFVVTPDSASLPAEACQTGRPVRIFDRYGDQDQRIKPRPGRLRQKLIYNGWMKPKRDFAAFHAQLADKRLINRDPVTAVAPDDLGRTAACIRALVQVRQTDPIVSHH